MYSLHERISRMPVGFSPRFSQQEKKSSLQPVFPPKTNTNTINLKTCSLLFKNLFYLLSISSLRPLAYSQGEKQEILLNPSAKHNSQYAARVTRAWNLGKPLGLPRLVRVAFWTRPRIKATSETEHDQKPHGTNCRKKSSMLFGAGWKSKRPY